MYLETMVSSSESSAVGVEPRLELEVEEEDEALSEAGHDRMDGD